MIQSIERVAILETLLNTLEVERYVRGPLLATIVDELTATGGLATAVDEARGILERLETGRLAEAEFLARVEALRQRVQALGASPEPGMVSTGEPSPRAMPRYGRHVGSASAA